MKRLHLMRHGQTLYNLQKLVQGRCDSPLTDRGVEEARAAGEWLAAQGIRFDRICTSPLGRALNTAHTVRDVLRSYAADPLALPAVEIVDGLMERSYGIYEEGPQVDVPADVWDPGEELVAQGGEGSIALRARMVSTLEGLMRDDDVEELLAVSHGSATLQFKKAWEHLARCPQDVALGNCCILVFDFDPTTGEFSNTAIVNR
ncbi:MAG: histidine phosphatase family protein [Collinsella sp.]|nr:histidine phosphatase family protein [Collinsella sp.]